MRSFQEKMLEQFERIVNEVRVGGRGPSEADPVFELMHQPQYANTGKLFVTRGFESPIEIRYGFHDSYCTIEVESWKVAALFEDSPPEYRVQHRAVTLDGSHGMLSRIAWHHLTYANSGERWAGLFVALKHLVLAEAEGFDPGKED